jgi:adenylate kinase
VNAIILFGSPGSGKGTQARLLTACLQVPHISTGDMLRERVRQGVAMGAAVAATMQSGALVSDDVVNRMVEERLSRADAVQGFVLDGYPRTVSQAEHLSEWLAGRRAAELVIYLNVDYNIIIQRLTGRRECPRCGTLYNLALQPPKVDSLCDLDGEKLAVRADDSEDVIRERLEAYRIATEPVLCYYREHGRRVVRVDADGTDSPEMVFEKLRRAMGAA